VAKDRVQKCEILSLRVPICFSMPPPEQAPSAFLSRFSLSCLTDSSMNSCTLVTKSGHFPSSRILLGHGFPEWSKCWNSDFDAL
jgi:hypothetical protein